MGSARDSFRVHYAKADDLHAARSELAAYVAKREFDGAYYRVVEDVQVERDGKVRLKAVSTSGKLEVGTITFDLKSGNSSIKWHDSDPDKD